jgi:hypothetical protein
MLQCFLVQFIVMFMTQYNLDYSDAYEVIGLKEVVQKYNFF